MGDDNLIGLMHVTPQNTPMINEEMKYNPFGPCAWRCYHLSTVKLADGDWDMPYMHLRHALQTMRFGSLK